MQLQPLNEVRYRSHLHAFMSDMSDVEVRVEVGVERGSWKESILQGGVLELELRTGLKLTSQTFPFTGHPVIS